MALIHDRSARGNTRAGWLNSYHTFSFGSFRDPTRMGHRALRVLNEDFVIPGAGFGKHGHEEMDILTYVIAGALKHEDSMGHTSIIRAGDFQHMYAGTGVFHSEMNASEDEPVHFLQIWIIPVHTGGAPSYYQAKIDSDATRNTFLPVAGPEPDKQQAPLRSDTRVYLARLAEGKKIERSIEPGRYGFAQVVNGQVEIENQRLSSGDGFQFDSTTKFAVTATSEAELLLFDLA